MQPNSRSCQFLPHDEVFNENIISNLSVAVANGLAIGYLFLKIGRIVIFENIISRFLFDCVQILLAYGTDIGSWVYQGIYC